MKSWMKVIAPFAYAIGLLAYVLLLTMTIVRVLSEGFSVYSVIAMVLGSIAIGWSYKELSITSKELLNTLTKYLPSPRDDDRQ